MIDNIIIHIKSYVKIYKLCYGVLGMNCFALIFVENFIKILIISSSNMNTNLNFLKESIKNRCKPEFYKNMPGLHNL